MGPTGKLGTRLAPLWGVVWTCALSCTLAAGCLVTDSPPFEVEPNLPPSIRAQTGAGVIAPGVHVLDLSAGGTPDVPLLVIVSDPNVEQTLESVVFFDGGTRSPMQTIGPTQDGSMDREVSIVDYGQENLSVPGCHHIVLWVSGRFDYTLSNTGDTLISPHDPGDLGTAEWWVFTKTDPTQTFDPSNCPTGTP